MSTGKSGLGVYVHVPFCTTRCAYCDFAIIAGQDHRIPQYLDGIEREIASTPERDGAWEAVSIHFGGGTPSKLDREGVARIVRAVRAHFTLRTGAEVGLEANPEDVTEARVAAWIDAGVTRITVGVQALEDAGLHALGRPGTAREGQAALRAARAAGIASLGADIIIGRPGQSLADWQRELDAVLGLDIDHLSLYTLETDAPTPLVRAMDRGLAPLADPDASAAMYELAVPALAAAGLARYEISNFARPGHESRHNVLYWTDQAYLGIGPSAASYVSGMRWTNPRRYAEWLRKVHEASLRDDVEAYDAETRVGEALVFGLRLDRGVDLGRLRVRHGEQAVLSRRGALDALVARGLLVADPPDRYRLDERARMIANEAFVELL